METRSKVVMASVYLGFFILSALVAFLLFTYLPGSEASAEGDMGGLNFKTGGAFAGFIISFWLLHLAVRSWYKHNLKLTGNVLDQDGEGLEGAMVSVSDVPGEEFTNRTGYFSKEIFGSKAEWMVRANAQHPVAEVRHEIALWRDYATVVIEASDSVIAQAQEMMRQGIHLKDALHVACAVSAQANYFVTTDRKLLNKLATIGRLKAMNPIAFIEEYAL